MKNVKPASNAPEYADLLDNFDKADAALMKASDKYTKTKYKAKTTSKKRVSKNAYALVQLQAERAEYRFKAAKIALEIAKLRIKLWLKDNSIESIEIIYEMPNMFEEHDDMPEAKLERRGRKKKSSNDDEDTAAPSITAEENVKVKKTPKVKEPKQAKTITETSPVENTETSSAVDVPVKKTRKPRAPKATETESIVASRDIMPEEEEGVSGSSARFMAQMDMAERALMPAEVAETPVEEAVAPVKEKKPSRTRAEITAVRDAIDNAFKASLKGDDFRIIEGIADKVTIFLHDNGILAFQDLATADMVELRKMLVANRFMTSFPTTWAQQAQLVVEGKLDELATLQATLKRGV